MENFILVFLFGMGFAIVLLSANYVLIKKALYEVIKKIMENDK